MRYEHDQFLMILANYLSITRVVLIMCIRYKFNLLNTFQVHLQQLAPELLNVEADCKVILALRDPSKVNRSFVNRSRLLLHSDLYIII
jgi:hypothetical protein